MSFLRTASPVTQPVYGGLQLQTSSSAVPIPIVYGVNKIPPNVLWNGNFQQHQSSGKGGKGGGGSTGKSGASQQTTYTSAIVLALCEGPILAVSSVWDNSTITPLANVATMNSPGLILGELGQAPWGDLSGSEALGYSGVALVTDWQISLGSSATLDSYSMEIQSTFRGGFNGSDGEPAAIIIDFLTNGQYGVGFPSSSIDTSLLTGVSGDSSVESYCKAMGLALSPALTNQENARDIMTRWLQLINCAGFWSEGLLKIKPYGDTPATGPLWDTAGYAFYTSNASQSTASQNPQTQTGTWSFTPDVEPIYSLDDDDFIAAGTNNDPVTIERIDILSAYNVVYLEATPRANFYDATPIPAFDQNAINTVARMTGASGLRIAPTITAHEICDSSVAAVSAQLILQRGLYVRNKYTFKCSWELCLLEPMDLVTLTDALLGLDNTAVRIISIEENDDGTLTVTAEEFPPGIATAVEYPTQAKAGTGIGANADASPVNTPIIFEPPYGLAGGLAVYIAVSGQNGQNWGGCNVFASSDDVSYQQIGFVEGAAVMGSLMRDLPNVASLFDFGQQTVDTKNTLAVDLSESNGVLNPASASDMLAGNSACFLAALTGPGEIVAYQDALLIGASQYALNILQRGTFDSAISDHPAGSAFAKLDGNIFKYEYQPDQIGQKVYLKFQSFNAFGAGLQNLADCAAYPYTITGSPLQGALEPPQNPVISYLAGVPQLSFDEVTDPRGPVRYKIYFGDSAIVAQQVGDVAHPPFALQRAGTYWVVSYISPLPNLVVTSDFSKSVEIAGALIIANQLEAYDQQASGWLGTLVNCSVSGISPDQILLLGSACNIDYGLASDPVTIAEDWGLASNDQINPPLDFGLAS
jgi:Putative phage tail protein